MKIERNIDLKNNLLETLKQAILTYNNESAVNIANKIIEKKIDLIKSLDTITSAIRDVGEKFDKGEVWLPELIGAAATMKKVMQVLEVEILKKKIIKETNGVVAIGTVYGDIHDIGKTMVTTLLTSNNLFGYALEWP